MSETAGFPLRGGTVSPTFISRSGWGKGSGRRSSALTALKIAVLAPIPIASVRMATAVNAGARRKVRRAKRASCSAASKKESPAIVRVSSVSDVRLPNLRRAAKRASSLESAPRAACSRCMASSERWKRISSSSSRVYCRAPVRARSWWRSPSTKDMRSGALHDRLDRDEHAIEARNLLAELLATGGGDGVVARLAAGGGLAPLRGHPPLLLEALERGVERALLDREHVIGELLDVC